MYLILSASGKVSGKQCGFLKFKREQCSGISMQQGIKSTKKMNDTRGTEWKRKRRIKFVDEKRNKFN